MADLELTLTWLGMSKYLDRFVEAGFDSWETVLEITENDLDILNVDLGHRRKLQREIANTKRLAQDPAFVTPLYRIEPRPERTELKPTASGSSTNEFQVPSKRGYRHRPKSDPNAPERPYSAYVMFSNHTREQLKDQNLSFTESSRLVGERWQNLSPDEREAWKQRGAVPWEKYKSDMAEYQKTDGFQEYQRYLTDFKAAHAAKKPDRRPSSSQHNQSPSDYQGGNITELPSPVADSRRSVAFPSPKGAKKGLKRLKKDDESWEAGSHSPRVKQACEPCRQRKIKCHGEHPTCRHCRESGVDCYYSGGRRDSKKRHDDGLWTKVKAYENLLLQFSPRLESEEQKAIQDALNRLPHVEDSREAYHRGEQNYDSDGGAESDVSGVGSMGSTGKVNQDDFPAGDIDNNAPAFVGQSSELKWIQRLKGELNPQSKANRSKAQPDAPVISEDMDTSIIGHQIDPFSLPLKSTADATVNAYFSTVHLSFPVLDKAEFMTKYEQLFNSMDPESYEDRTFISIIQLVLAIGAVHAHFVDAEWSGDQRDHMLYFAQARVVAVDNGILNDRCFLGQVQVFGLSGFYLLVTDQLNRSWNMIGLAIRSAQSLGLHLQDVTRSTSRAEKEIRAQTWFAVSSLESVLTVTTGRPSMVQERHCTVVMPPTYAGEMSSQSGTPSDYSYQTSKDFGTRAKNPSQRSFAERLSDLNTNQNSAIYFRHYTELCVLSKEAVSELYNPHIRDNKWSEIQSLMESFDRRLLQWKDALNPPFNVATSSSDPETESCRVALRIIFHSTRAIVNRPCLCRLNQRMTDQSSSSRQKNRGFAIKCVDSSRAVLNLILNKPDRVVLQQGASWWMLMGHLKRALTVLLLELSFRAEHKPGDASEILDEAKAAVNWLHIRASSDPTARRTWVTMSRLLQLAAPKVGGHTADIDVASEDPIAGSSFQQDLLSSSTPTTTHSNAFTPQWMYGGVVDPNQGLNFGDVAARSELDRFGFLRQHGGVGSLFPTTSESGRRGGKGGADQEMGDEGWRGEWWPRNG